MPANDLNSRSVRELQRIATQADLPRRPAKKRTMSRAARLQLIDKLSRWGATGLAAIGGASIYIAIVAGQTHPARAAAWTLLILASIWACRTLRARFRAGEEIASRPFRWRAHYTSCLSVLGVAFGGGAVLLIPADATATTLHIIALLFLAASVAGVAHAAHRPSAVAIAGPTVLFAFVALARSGAEPLAMAGATALAVLGVGFIALTTAALYGDARRRHPRTSFLRSDVEAPSSSAGDPETTEISATTG